MNLNEYAQKIEQATLGVRDMLLFISALAQVRMTCYNTDNCRREDDYWRPWREVVDERVYQRDRAEALQGVIDRRVMLECRFTVIPIRPKFLLFSARYMS